MKWSRTEASWWLLLATVVPLVIFVCPLVLDIPLLDPDEGIHASIAQEMVERGEWVTPSLFGKPFFDKPIAYFWAQSLSLRLLGMNEAAVRLPGLLLGLLGAITTAVVAWRLFGGSVGLLAGLFYATMILPTALAQAPAHDVALLPAVNLAILAFWESDRAATRRAAAAWTLGAGLALGLACLTKGLVGIALVGVAYGFHLLLTARLRPAACVRAVAALTIAALVAAPWYAAMEVHNPGYLSYFFLDRHLRGYTTTTQPHGSRPWWYYLPLLLGGGLPWIAYLPVTLQQWWLRRLEPGCVGHDGKLSLLWCWLTGGTLFLSLGHSKLVTYVWPVFPPIAVLAALAWNDLLEGALLPRARHTLSLILWVGSLASPLLLPLSLAVTQSRFPVNFSWPTWTMAALVATLAWVPLAFWHNGQVRATLAAAVLVTVSHFAFIMGLVLPQVAAVSSGRDLAAYFNRSARMPSQIVVVEERIGSLVFYLTPELRASLRERGLAAVRAKQLAELPLAQTGTFVAIAEGNAQDLPMYLRSSDVRFGRAGQFRVYEASALRTRPVAEANVVNRRAAESDEQ